MFAVTMTVRAIPSPDSKRTAISNKGVGWGVKGCNKQCLAMDPYFFLFTERLKVQTSLCRPLDSCSPRAEWMLFLSFFGKSRFHESTSGQQFTQYYSIFDEIGNLFSLVHQERLALSTRINAVQNSCWMVKMDARTASLIPMASNSSYPLRDSFSIRCSPSRRSKRWLYGDNGPWFSYATQT